MSAIVEYIYNGTVHVGCDENSIPLMKEKRTKPRKFTNGEKEVEKDYIKQNRLKEFNKQSCNSKKYLESIFPQRCVNYKNVRSFATYISLMCSIIYPREAYRRLNSSLHWIDMNYKQIMGFLSRHTIEIKFEDGTIIHAVPDIEYEEIISLKRILTQIARTWQHWIKYSKNH